MSGRGLVICTVIVLLTISILLLVTLLPFSFKRIAVDEVGIKYHTISKKLYDDPEDLTGQGNHYVQPGETFFKFKARFVTMRFVNSEPISRDYENDNDPRNYGGISCLTRDGLSLELQISIQYILRRQEIPQLFLKFGLGYEQIYAYMVRSSVRDTCGAFSANQFYTERGAVQEMMLEKAQERLNETHADAGFLQLVNIQFPLRFERAVSSKEEARADVDQAQAQRAQAVLQSQTQVLEATEATKVTLVRAQSAANATIAAALIDADAIRNEFATQATVYKEVMTTFNFTAAELINFISIEKLPEISELLIGVGAPGAFSYPAELP